MKKIDFIEAYHDITDIKDFFSNLNDDFSNGPYNQPKSIFGFQGCYDRPLRLELLNNPVHILFDKLQNDYGEFDIIEGSIRYLCAPFLPHTDIANSKNLKEIKDTKRNYCTFLIPLSWKNGYTPGTVFFNSPPNLNEDLYSECQAILPKYTPEFEKESWSFSVKEIYQWKNPGDLIVWHDFWWHSTTAPETYTSYSKDSSNWVKEFITIRVLFKNQ